MLRVESNLDRDAEDRKQQNQNDEAPAPQLCDHEAGFPFAARVLIVQHKRWIGAIYGDKTDIESYHKTIRHIGIPFARTLSYSCAVFSSTSVTIWGEP